MSAQHKKQPHHQQQRKHAADKEAAEIAALERRLREEAPPSGSNPLLSTAFNKDSSNSEETPLTFPAARKFVHFPISQRTQDALAQNNFIRLTDIQRASLPHALCGRDVLGAAKTGSGKTLAFSIPVIESLYRARWSSHDGLGALIISPTRELALQIFEVLRKVGSNHDLSAGLLIGGKSFDEEAKRVLAMNILVCTPGRLLQHMDQTPGFNCDNLQILVLDEADRILDLGFEATLTAIVQNLPESRQTLLFSATQTKSVNQLAKLSLRNPEYVAVHEAASEATPINLVQTYMVCEAHQKFDILFSFIRTHLKSKCIVFVSSCKQVRFLFEAFRRLHPGVPLMELHGKMKQSKRMAIYYDFVKKPAAVMFSTDIAARGLDFPGVDWVLQFDCPDTVASYIHRAGRTARYKSNGNGLLLLLPSEIAILEQMEAQRIPIKKVKANPEKLQSTAEQFSSALAESSDLKYLAQKSFITYLRSVYLQSDKSIFDVTQIDAEKLAAAMGLPGTPKIKFAKNNARSEKNMPVALREMIQVERLKQAAKSGDVDAAAKLESIQQEKKQGKGESDAQLRRIDKLLNRQSSSVYADARLKIVADGNQSDDDSDASESDSEDEDALFQLRRKDHELGAEHAAIGAKSRKQKKRERMGDDVDQGEALDVEDEADAALATTADYQRHLKKVSARVKSGDVFDKIHEHERVKELHQKQKQTEKLKSQRAQPTVAMIGGDDDGEFDESDEQSDDNDFQSDSDGDDQSDDDQPDMPEPVTGKRKNRDSFDEPAGKVSKQSLQDSEQLALKILASRK